jgi:hypothetical protein
VASEARSGSTVETRSGSAGAVEKTKPISGAHVSAGRQSWLRPAGGEGLAGPAGAKAKWAGKGSRAESEEERFLN